MVLEKIEAEVEIKSDGDDLLHMFGGQKAHHAPNHGPGIVPKVELHHGEPGSVGSMKMWTFYADGKAEKSKEKVTMADYENKKVQLEGVEGDYIAEYQQLIATFEVVPKGDKNILKITLEYEKQNPNVPVPRKYMDFIVALVKEVDSKIAKPGLEKIEAEVEIKSDGDDILHMFGGQKSHHAPTHGPGIVPKLDLHHGEPGSVGSMKMWDFYADGKLEKCKEKVTVADYDKKIVQLVAMEGDYIKEYKQCIGTYQVVPKGDKNIFKITFEYEKQNPSVPVPHKYMDFFVALVKEVDAKIAKD